MDSSKYLFLDMYEYLSKDISFLCNSEVRIKILKSLDDGPKTMRELNDLVLLSYSSISNNLNRLAEEGFIFKKERKFYLTNLARLNLINYIDFDNSVKVTNFLNDFLVNHDLSSISDDSLRDLADLDGSRLVESIPIDIYKPHNEFKNLLESANRLKVIFPYLHPDYPNLIRNLLLKEVSIDLLINNDIMDKLVGDIGIDLVEKSILDNLLTIKYLDDNLNLSLALSDDFVSIGLFKKDGTFDQNRLIVSDKKKAIEWGNKLFLKHSSNALFYSVI